MGVKGLTTFLRENRSLCKSLHLDKRTAKERDPIIVIVDAWGIIFRLYQDSLPWTTGGEYLAFYRLVKRFITAWKAVGLEPIFVFDGSSPPGKHETIVGRLNQNISRSQLFYTTSQSLRSSPSFSRNSSILPSFCSHTFIQALTDMGVETLFVPLGEADGVCVVMAEQRGGFVLGQDSDFVILIGEGGGKGYAPLDMVSWYEEEVEEEDADANSSMVPDQPDGLEADDFTPVSNRRSQQHGRRQARESPLLPPSDARNPILHIPIFPPAALRQRLRLPATVLPLFAALVGNDYTPPHAASYFFESTLTVSQRIEKVARVLREQLYSPSANKAGSSAGDHAVNLVLRVIKKMLVRDFQTASELQALADTIVEATLQYILPSLNTCCSSYPFCGSLDTGCRGTGLSPAAEWYSSASDRGELRAVRHAYLFPNSVIPYQVMEDPGKASIKLQGLCAVRKAAWAIADEAVGLRFAAAIKADESVDRASEERDTGAQGSSATTLVDEDTSKADHDALDATQSTSLAVNHEDSATPPRIVIEYVRSSNRIIARECVLDAPRQLDDTPRCVQPLEARLQTYLGVMGCDLPIIRALPIHYQPIVAIIRFCITDTRERLRRIDVEAILRACIGTYASWQRDKHGDTPTKKATTMEYPFLTNRNAQIVAYFQAVMTDAHVLAESLLLSDHPSCKDSRSDIHITHLRAYVFYCGSALHMFLSGSEPQGWKWSTAEQEAFDTCLSAIAEGLEDRILGWVVESRPQEWRRNAAPLFPRQEIKQHEPIFQTGPQRPDVVDGKRKSRPEESWNWRTARRGQSGRFDLLGGLSKS